MDDLRVLISAGVISIAYGGTYVIGLFSQSPTYDMQSPLHHLLPYSCTIFQAVLTSSSLVVAISVSVLVKLTPIGLVPEVPLLQAFQSIGLDGRLWIRMMIAALTITCLCSTLVEISLPLHRTVQRLSKDGLLPGFLSANYAKTDTPFFGCAFLGAMTAVLATLGDLTSLLLISGASKMTLDLVVCLSALTLRYGVVGMKNLPKDDSRHNAAPSSLHKSSDPPRHFGRKRRKKRQRLGSSRKREGEGRDGQPRPAYGNSLSSLGGCGFQLKRPRRGARSSGDNKSWILSKGNQLRLFFGFSPYKNVSSPNESRRQGPIGDAEVLPNIIRGSQAQPPDEPRQNRLSDSESETSEFVDSPSGYETESTSPSDYSGEEDGAGVQAESVKSGGSSNSESSDTDIDAVITEYRKTVPVSVSTIGGPAGGPDHLRQTEAVSGPTTSSVRRVKFLVILLVFSLYAQFIILESLKASLSSNSSIGLNVATSLIIFYIILSLSQEPQCAPNGGRPTRRQASKIKALMSTIGRCCIWSEASAAANYSQVESGHFESPPQDEGCSRVPVTPWCQALAMFLNISLLGSLIDSAYREFSVLLASGIAVYLTYGVRYSHLASKKKRKSGSAMTPQQSPSVMYLSPSSAVSPPPPQNGPTNRTFASSTDLQTVGVTAAAVTAGAGVPRSRSEDQGLAAGQAGQSFFKSKKEYAKLEQIGLESVRS